jgi:hypothetical protein
MSIINPETMCEKKNLMITIIQEYYEQYNRQNEVHFQRQCETDLTLRILNDTIRNQERVDVERLSKIEELEKEISSKNKQLYEYEVMIKSLEDKLEEVMCEKEEENRFDMIRIQANEILSKEREIERLESLLRTKEIPMKKRDPIKEIKILNVIDMIQESMTEDSMTEDSIEISVVKKEDDNDNLKDIYSPEAIKPDEEGLEYGANAADIASDRMAANLANKYIQKDPDEGISEEEPKTEGEDEEGEDEGCEDQGDDYEILTYRKKEYWIKKGEDPQCVYEVLEEDGLGGRLGIYKGGSNGKMKVVLDKK